MPTKPCSLKISEVSPVADQKPEPEKTCTDWLIIGATPPPPPPAPPPPPPAPPPAELPLMYILLEPPRPTSALTDIASSPKILTTPPRALIDVTPPPPAATISEIVAKFSYFPLTHARGLSSNFFSPSIIWSPVIKTESLKSFCICASFIKVLDSIICPVLCILAPKSELKLRL